MHDLRFKFFTNNPTDLVNLREVVVYQKPDPNYVPISTVYVDEGLNNDEITQFVTEQFGDNWSSFDVI